MANGVVADRTMPLRHIRSSRIAALAVGLALLLLPTEVHAVCAMGKIPALSLCQEGACTDGFKVENQHIPHTYCKTRPVVRDLTDEERANFRDIIQRFEQEAPNGIYQLRTYPSCLQDGWQDARCLAEATIMRLADASDAQTLVQYRTEWLAKERQAHRAATIRSWLRPIMFSLSHLIHSTGRK